MNLPEAKRIHAALEPDSKVAEALGWCIEALELREVDALTWSHAEASEDTK